jgi:uncharacterized protein (DUF58 family)
LITDLLHPDELVRLKNLQVLARNRVEGLCSGLHRSPNKGQSVEFREHRPYSRGDTLRSIDWKVFGKSDRLFIRQYEEETNLRCHLMIDTSGSMNYSGATSSGSKFRFAAKLAAGFAYLMLNQQDSVGLVTYDWDIHGYLPPRARPTQLGAIANQLLQQDSHRAGGPENRSTGATQAGGSDAIQRGAADVAVWSRVFHSLLPRLRRGGIVVVFSDCFGNVEQLGRDLALLRQARNDVVVFQIMDRDEVEFSFRSQAEFRSLERFGKSRRIDPNRFRKAYLQRLQEFYDQLNQHLRSNQIEVISVVTDQAFADVLAEFLASRRRLR